jgi:hypothetical protein
VKAPRLKRGESRGGQNPASVEMLCPGQADRFALDQSCGASTRSMAKPDTQKILFLFYIFFFRFAERRFFFGQ